MDNNDELQIFLHNIVWLRNHYGISKKKMASMLGIGVQSLTKIEHGELPPRLRANIFLAVEQEFSIPPFIQLTVRLGE